MVESRPHRAAIRLVRRFRHSTVTQDVRLWSNSPRLEFKTALDWHDRRWLLKARFHLALRSGQASFETAFGAIERPTHRNTTWEAARFEVVGRRFADLSEPGYGVALLNDGKYGYHAFGNELGLSLLRSPAYPDPLADEGGQTFIYALLPHSGSWLEGGVLMEAEDLNRPLLARSVLVARPVVAARGTGYPLGVVCGQPPAPSGGQLRVVGRARAAVARRPSQPSFSWSIVRLDGLPLGLGSLKVLEDGGGLSLRVYEPQGARGSAQLKLPPG